MNSNKNVTNSLCRIKDLHLTVKMGSKIYPQLLYRDKLCTGLPTKNENFNDDLKFLKIKI